MARSVLIADDDEYIAVTLRYLMEDQGYQVNIARDGEEALSMIGRAPPDLLLLDADIPGRNGYDVCQTLRSSPDRQRIGIVMLSARGRPVDAAKGLALGADAYVTKPFFTRDLMKGVRSALDRGRADDG